MANWLNKINIADLHNQYDDGELDASQVAAALAERLKELEPRLNFGGTCNAEQKQDFRDDLQDIIDELELVGDVDDYDHTLQDLYDLGDTSMDGQPLGKKFLWIETTVTA